jgi:hypothetical protein
MPKKSGAAISASLSLLFYATPCLSLSFEIDPQHTSIISAGVVIASAVISCQSYLRLVLEPLSQMRLAGFSSPLHQDQVHSFGQSGKYRLIL